MAMIDKSFDDLLATWEGNYKKGLLTFWLLLVLHEQESYAFEMSRKVTDLSRGTVSADEKSIYRALNRFEGLGLVESSWRDSSIGPKRRYYRMSGMGLALLQAFIERNILLFKDPGVDESVRAVMETEAVPE